VLLALWTMAWEHVAAGYVLVVAVHCLLVLEHDLLLGDHLVRRGQSWQVLPLLKYGSCLADWYSCWILDACIGGSCSFLVFTLVPGLGSVLLVPPSALCCAIGTVGVRPLGVLLLQLY